MIRRMGDSNLGRMTRLVSSRVKLLQRTLLEALRGLVPERSAESMLRKVDGTVDSLRDELGKAVAAGHLVRKAQIEQQSRYEELTREVERAMEQGREDLAKVAVARQLELEAQLSVLERQSNSSHVVTQEIERSLLALLEAQKVLRQETQEIEGLAAHEHARYAVRPENTPRAVASQVQARLQMLKSARAFKQDE